MGGEGRGHELFERLGLAPHPEGGWYRSTWRAPAQPGARPIGSAIYYLLQGGEAAARHRVDATEIWHHYVGAPVALDVEEAGGQVVHHLLGPDVLSDQLPQAVVPPDAWQRARALGPFALVGCTVCPAFTFDGFEMEG